MMRSRYFFLLIFLLLSSCSHPVEDRARPTVTVSIMPEKYFVKKIAGDLLEVNVMIPSGASPVTYDPSPMQMEDLEHSDLYLKIGRLAFENVWIPKFAMLNPGLKIYDLSKGVSLIKTDGQDTSRNDHRHDTDPHIWMSPGNVRVIAGNIERILIRTYPGDSAVFRKNHRAFIREINRIDSMYRSHADQLHGKSFLIYHPALTYLAREYGMDQVVLEYEGKEPPPAHIRKVIDIARDRDIRDIFVQEQFNPDNARALASEIGGRIIVFDPLAEDWDFEMKFILGKLVGNSENRMDKMR